VASQSPLSAGSTSLARPSLRPSSVLLPSCWSQASAPLKRVFAHPPRVASEGIPCWHSTTLEPVYLGRRQQLGRRANLSSLPGSVRPVIATARRRPFPPRPDVYPSKPSSSKTSPNRAMPSLMPW